MNFNSFFNSCKGFSIKLLRFSKSFSRKAFIGPIGDDLPSLIPLIFALIIFFASFSSTFNVFDSKSKEFADSIKILKLSTALKGDSYFSGLQEFMQVCDEQKNSGVNFKVYLLEDLTKPSLTSSEVDVLKLVNTPFDELDFAYVVKGRDDSGLEVPIACSNVSDDVTITSTTKIQVRMFPVALEEKHQSLSNVSVVRPVILMVVTWT